MSSRKAELEETDSEKKQTIEINALRSQKFTRALSKLIERYVNSLKLSLFQNTYSEIHENFPNAIDTLHNQLQTQLSCHITSSVRKVCLSHQVISFIEDPEEFKGSNCIKTSTHLGRRRCREVSREEPPKKPRDPKLLEKIRFRDNLLKKLKKMEAASTEYETIMFKNHDNIVKLGEKIKQRRDLLLKGVGIMGDFALSDQMNMELTLLDLSKIENSDEIK